MVYPNILISSYKNKFKEIINDGSLCLIGVLAKYNGYSKILYLYKQRTQVNIYKHSIYLFVAKCCCICFTNLYISCVIYVAVL